MEEYEYTLHDAGSKFTSKIAESLDKALDKMYPNGYKIVYSFYQMAVVMDLTTRYLYGVTWSKLD